MGVWQSELRMLGLLPRFLDPKLPQNPHPSTNRAIITFQTWFSSQCCTKGPDLGDKTRFGRQKGCFSGWFPWFFHGFSTKICPMIQWIGLRENLQETIDFLKIWGFPWFSCKFSLKPIHWMIQQSVSTSGSAPRSNKRCTWTGWFSSRDLGILFWEKT